MDTPIKPIGGYFELELNTIGKHYHNDAIKLNSGRCAFEYILRVRGYEKVYLPYYTCDVMLEPIDKLGLEYEFYHIDNNLDPVFAKPLNTGECFVYTNYYGIKQSTVEVLAQTMSNLIIDNSQAFFSPALDGIDTFYSARKFFGVPDGAYLYIDNRLPETFTPYLVSDKMSHLLKRIEQGAQFGYADFCTNDHSHSGAEIHQMSTISDAILKTIDYKAAKAKREENFVYLHEILSSTNLLPTPCHCAAMVYPYMVNCNDLRQRLIEQDIFVAKYWPNVSQWTDSSVELDLASNLLALPIDQRYDSPDMNRIIKIIESYGI